MKAVNNNLFTIEKYDYKTFKNIAQSKWFVEHFADKTRNTNSSNKLSFIEVKKGAIDFDYKKDFDFYSYISLEDKIKERTEQFEKINWQPKGQLQYASAKELYLWELWLEQIERTDWKFIENGL